MKFYANILKLVGLLGIAKNPNHESEKPLQIILVSFAKWTCKLKDKKKNVICLC